MHHKDKFWYVAFTYLFVVIALFNFYVHLMVLPGNGPEPASSPTKGEQQN